MPSYSQEESEFKVFANQLVCEVISKTLMKNTENGSIPEVVLPKLLLPVINYYNIVAEDADALVKEYRVAFMDALLNISVDANKEALSLYGDVITHFDKYEDFLLHLANKKSFLEAVLRSQHSAQFVNYMAQNSEVATAVVQIIKDYCAPSYRLPSMDVPSERLEFLKLVRNTVGDVGLMHGASCDSSDIRTSVLLQQIFSTPLTHITHRLKG